jgi:hypothetical protein
LAIVTLLGIGGWFGYQTYYADRFALKDAEQKLAEQQAQIVALNADLEAKRREIQRLETAVRLLKVDRRIARITVLSQDGSAAGGDLTTNFSFVELNEDGNPLDAPRQFTVKGDLAYLDAWVVKFADEYVEQGDPLRATSVCLFRRIFGEAQRPVDGFVLDPVGSQPAAYRTGGLPSEFEQEIWSQFWEYANDADKAQGAGIRAAHGEAPSIKLVPGKRYKVLLRASGGLTVVPEDAPERPADRPTAGTL